MKNCRKATCSAMWIFLGAIAVVALLGADSDLRHLRRQTAVDGTGYSDVYAADLALIIILTKTISCLSQKRSLPFRMIAIVAVYGIAWDGRNHVRAHMSKFRRTW
ncbi:anaerobic C4-dicarboxylate transporter family protein [Shigella flexneri]